LRPIEAADLPELTRLLSEPEATGEFQWFGFRRERVRRLESRWADDGLLGQEESFLAVALDDGTCIGWVNWRPSGGFGAFEIGAALLPEHRGRGWGTQAQRLLTDYLLATTTTHRLEAGTEAGNIPEQRALEAIGFVREGMRRQCIFRQGEWRDAFLYSLLRTDLAAYEPDEER